MAVHQATNEELIASFLRDCDLLRQKEGEVMPAVGWRLMVLQEDDCGDPKRQKSANDDERSC